MEDRHCTAWSVALVSGFAGLALLYCVEIFGATHRGGGWFQTPDVSMLLRAGSSLVHGHLRAVYSNRELYDLPLSFPLTGAVSVLAGWLHLTTAPYPTIDFLVVPAWAAMGIPVLYQARRLAWELGMRRLLWTVQAVAAFVVLVPTIEWGHVEDVLALACFLAALRRLMTHDSIPACIYLSLAIGFKQWALMALPYFVITAPAGRRLRALVASMGVPVMVAAPFLILDFHHAFLAYTSPVTQVLAFPGHPWVAPMWLGWHSSQANRTLALLVAAGLAWQRRHLSTDPQQIVGTAGLILLIRPLTETINYAYYWSPALLLLAVIGMAGHGRLRVGSWAWPVAAMAWTLPHSNDLTALDWWGGEAVLLAVIAWRLALPLGLSRPVGDDLPGAGRPQLAEVAG